jgi:hypothetical protein
MAIQFSFPAQLFSRRPGGAVFVPQKVALASGGHAITPSRHHAITHHAALDDRS